MYVTFRYLFYIFGFRFGDSQLHYCEVMLRDVYDSKRINSHLQSDPNFDLANKVISTVFEL